MLAYEVGEQLADSIGTGGVRDAAIDVALSCINTPVSMAGLTTVYGSAEGDVVHVVQAVPATALDAVSIDRPTLLNCLRDRVKSGADSLVDAIVLFELDVPAEGSASSDSRARLRASLVRIFGTGASLAMSSEWGMSDGMIDTTAILGWSVPAGNAVLKTGSIGECLAPLSVEVLAALSVDDLFSMHASRIHDPAVQTALVARLRSTGFERTAEFMTFPEVPLHRVHDRPSALLDRELRAKVVSMPVVTAALLTDGRFGSNWRKIDQPWLESAVAAFNEGTPESLSRAITLLADNIGAGPTVETISLLSAALLAVDEPYLAEPLARAAFFEQPSHRFAGVNALRASKAMDNRDRARELYPIVLANAQFGTWGRNELKQVAEWLGVPPPPSDAPTAPPEPASPRVD
jgi:hypothetical protein